MRVMPTMQWLKKGLACHANAAYSALKAQSLYHDRSQGSAQARAKLRQLHPIAPY